MKGSAQNNTDSKTGQNRKYLLETCLISHGLKSISDEMLARAFAGQDDPFAWVDEGEIRIGSIEEYLPFRRSGKGEKRINHRNLDAFLQEGRSGALTASGTMEVCRRCGFSAAVTCGMGGFRGLAGEGVPNDLEALAEIPVPLIAASPKDMLDIRYTIQWLQERNICVLGTGTDVCTGYVFSLPEVKLTGKVPASHMLSGHLLILNPIDENKRIRDPGILEKAVQRGLEAEAAGGYFHPAVNAALDDLTEGYASRIQLEAFVENAKLAEKLG